jgi:hypothetical protein
MCGSVVGASSLAEDDVSRMFPKFVFGSFVESLWVIDVEVRTGLIGCDVQCVGRLLVPPRSRKMMFRGCFRNSFLGHSWSHLVLVRPVNSWGLGREVPASLIKMGLGCGHKGTYVPRGMVLGTRYSAEVAHVGVVLIIGCNTRCLALSNFQFG